MFFFFFHVSSQVIKKFSGKKIKHSWEFFLFECETKRNIFRGEVMSVSCTCIFFISGFFLFTGFNTWKIMYFYNNLFSTFLWKTFFSPASHMKKIMISFLSLFHGKKNQLSWLIKKNCWQIIHVEKLFFSLSSTHYFFFLFFFHCFCLVISYFFYIVKKKITCLDTWKKKTVPVENMWNITWKM